MLSWVVLNFILFIYNNAFQLTYSLIWPTQKGHMNKVCPPFCLEVFLELAFLKQANFFKVVFCPPNGKNMLSPGFFECKFFSQFFIFFPNLVYNESLYYCNCCMLEHISYLGKFWFVRYGPKWSWPIRFRDFSINRKTQMAVSHEEINEINWVLVYPSNSFLRNGSLGFSDFWQNGR